MLGRGDVRSYRYLVYAGKPEQLEKLLGDWGKNRYFQSKTDCGRNEKKSFLLQSVFILWLSVIWLLTSNNNS